MTVTHLAASASTARMADGTILRTLTWSPETDPWAAALVVHGLGEHAGWYGNVAAALVAAGIVTHGYDHRGFGGSAGPRAYVDRWARYHDDLEERLLALRSERPDLPIVMYAHSMGGLIAAGYVLAERARPLPDRLILSAPGLDSTVPDWKRRLASMLTNVLPRMRIANGLSDDGLTCDPTVTAAVAADTLRVRTSTVRLGAEAFREQARVGAAIAGIDRMPVPTYVLHGSADPIVPVSASADLGGKGNVTRRVHDGLRYECHNEPQHAAVLAGVVAWIEATLGRVANPRVSDDTGTAAGPAASPPGMPAAAV